MKWYHYGREARAALEVVILVDRIGIHGALSGLIILKAVSCVQGGFGI